MLTLGYSVLSCPKDLLGPSAIQGTVLVSAWHRRVMAPVMNALWTWCEWSPVSLSGIALLERKRPDWLREALHGLLGEVTQVSHCASQLLLPAQNERKIPFQGLAKWGGMGQGTLQGTI